MAQHIVTLDPSGHPPEGLASSELHGVPLTWRWAILVLVSQASTSCDCGLQVPRPGHVFYTLKSEADFTWLPLWSQPSLEGTGLGALGAQLKLGALNTRLFGPYPVGGGAAFPQLFP